MILSVWNHGSGRYDYYEVPKVPTSPDHLHTVPRVEIGVAADDAAWPLLGQSRKVGSGSKAKGVVGTHLPFGVPLGDVSTGMPTWMKLGLVALGIYVVTR